MDKLPKKHSIGIEFFRFPGLHSLDYNDYFKCIDLIRPLLNNPDFKDSTPGFYISYITNMEDDVFNSLRITYFTINSGKTQDTIRKFADQNADKIAIFDSNWSVRPDKNKPLQKVKNGESRKRNFLNTYTQIGLDLLDYDTLYSRRLVAEYRLTYSPQKNSCKPLFEPAFKKHSKFFNQLGNSSKKQLWEDLNFWHPIVIQGYVADWTHMLVNMLLPNDWIYLSDRQTGESLYKDLFLKSDPRPPITGKQKEGLLKIFNLDIPNGWTP